MIKRDDRIIFSDDSITSNGEYVMMRWELPVMNSMANEVCKLGGDILEIGFGMGLSANQIQKNNIKSHTIVEINHDIYQKAIDWSKGKNVKLVFDDFLSYLETTDDKFDGIFFDPHPIDILGIGDDDFIYGKLFFDKIRKLCKNNCIIVPFLLGTSVDVSYLIDYVPLKSINSIIVDIEEDIICPYFKGNKSQFFVFNI